MIFCGRYLCGTQKFPPELYHGGSYYNMADRLKGSSTLDLPTLNSLDAEGYAVFDEKSFLGWGQAAEEAGPQGLAPSAVQSQKVAVMNKT